MSECVSVCVCVRTQGWLAVVKAGIRKRTRWNYAVEHSEVLEKIWAFRSFATGVAALRADRIAKEKAARKAIGFLVDAKIARAGRMFRALRAHADERIAERARQRVLMKKALALWQRQQYYAVLRRYPPV